MKEFGKEELQYYDISNTAANKVSLTVLKEVSNPSCEKHRSIERGH